MPRRTVRVPSASDPSTSAWSIVKPAMVDVVRLATPPALIPVSENAACTSFSTNVPSTVPFRSSTVPPPTPIVSVVRCSTPAARRNFEARIGECHRAGHIEELRVGELRVGHRCRRVNRSLRGTAGVRAAFAPVDAEVAGEPAAVPRVREKRQVERSGEPVEIEAVEIALRGVRRDALTLIQRAGRTGRDRRAFDSGRVKDDVRAPAAGILMDLIPPCQTAFERRQLEQWR